MYKLKYFLLIITFQGKCFIKLNYNNIIWFCFIPIVPIVYCFKRVFFNNKLKPFQKIKYIENTPHKNNHPIEHIKTPKNDSIKNTTEPINTPKNDSIKNRFQEFYDFYINALFTPFVFENKNNKYCKKNIVLNPNPSSEYIQSAQQSIYQQTQNFLSFIELILICQAFKKNENYKINNDNIIFTIPYFELYLYDYKKPISELTQQGTQTITLNTQNIKKIQNDITDILNKKQKFYTVPNIDVNKIQINDLETIKTNDAKMISDLLSNQDGNNKDIGEIFQCYQNLIKNRFNDLTHSCNIKRKLITNNDIIIKNNFNFYQCQYIFYIINNTLYISFPPKEDRCKEIYNNLIISYDKLFNNDKYKLLEELTI